MRLAALGETDTERAYALTWAGLALADLPTDRIFPETHARVSQALLEFFQANPPRVEPRLRRPLGLALGAVGDPRFMRAQIVIGSGAGWRFPALITIPAGEFLMGTSDAEADALQKQNAGTWDDEKPQRRVYVSEFEIGKYPITNQDFRAFWHADGYEDETLWSADGWKWRKGKLDADLSVYSKDYQETVKYWLDGRPVEKRGEPFFWRDPQWNAPNLPVVGVTWFEAEAFCKWLTRMSNQGNKGTGKQVIWRLPTEAEWEKAARGPQNYLWSWGNEWDANKCNSEASKFNATSPVGMYPDGTWKDEKGNVGPLDMMGNVWEWCGDWWQGDLYETRANELVKDPRGPASGNVRVVRGGSWNNARRYCRAAYRYGDVPVGFYDYLGFRVVVVPLPRS
jgi:formylglycine-generating enzyme required for sulfatase activity